MRSLGANTGGTNLGVLTDQPGKLTNDFFANVLSMDTVWSAKTDDQEVFDGHDRTTGKLKYTATRVDLVFGSNSQLRAISEVYAGADANEKFVNDFVSAWNKVMMLDRFDLK